jgi:HCOMODA/2-hydroxy-3-carboxy-muconic semialdehyde decarboxylase
MLINELVLANHILYDQQVVDGFGHVSVRSGRDPDKFLLARSMPPSMVQPEDIITYDFDGTDVDARGSAGYLERFIHAEIYRARPDVMAIVHSHSVSVLPFGIARSKLRPVYHMAGFLINSSRFEIREEFGAGTDMLISNSAMGKSLAKALGCNCVALMRGHGSVAVGSNLQEAVYRAVYTEINARAQIQALTLEGPLEFLTEAESKAATATTARHYDRCWSLWRDMTVKGN